MLLLWLPLLLLRRLVALVLLLSPVLRLGVVGQLLRAGEKSLGLPRAAERWWAHRRRPGRA